MVQQSSQSADSLWHDSRKKRITSSPHPQQKQLIQEILGYKQFAQTKKTKEGLSKEPEIIQEFLNTLNEKGHKRL